MRRHPTELPTPVVPQQLAETERKTIRLPVRNPWGFTNTRPLDYHVVFVPDARWRLISIRAVPRYLLGERYELSRDEVEERMFAKNEMARTMREKATTVTSEGPGPEREQKGKKTTTLYVRPSPLGSDHPLYRARNDLLDAREELATAEHARPQADFGPLHDRLAALEDELDDALGPLVRALERAARGQRDPARFRAELGSVVRRFRLRPGEMAEDEARRLAWLWSDGMARRRRDGGEDVQMEPAGAGRAETDREAVQAYRSIWRCAGKRIMRLRIGVARARKAITIHEISKDDVAKVGKPVADEWEEEEAEEADIDNPDEEI